MHVNTNSSNFIIQEFTDYKIFLYDRVAHHEDVDESIEIPIEEGIIFFIFYKRGDRRNHKDHKHGINRYFIYISTDKFDRYVDILRHEKPLFVALHKEKLWAYITTSFEPVGEGDVDTSN